MMYGELCTKFYDADKQYASQNEVDFYTQHFNSNCLILEPMCGSGRLLIPLLQAGLSVHGLDNSPQMLASCKVRAQNLGLNPTLFTDDVIHMNSSQQYDGIIIPYGSFQLFYPRTQAYLALMKFKNFLKKDGKLIMDLFVPWDALYENNNEVVSEREVKIDQEIIKASNRSIANKHEQFIISETHYSEIINKTVVKEEDEQMYIAWYYRYEMELLLEKFNFKNIEVKARFLNNENYNTYIAEI